MVCGYKSSSELSVSCREEDVASCDDNKCWNHCKFGRTQQTRLLAVEGSEYSKNQQFHKLMGEWLQHAIDEHGMPDNRPKKTHTGNGAFQGAFAFTLTKSPDDPYTEFDMIKAVRKVMSQKSCPVARYAWFLEYGDDEKKLHPHIHGLYETETQGRIEAKHFKRAWPIWDEKHKLGRGFRGGYHRPVRSEESYRDYIKKDSGKNEHYNIETIDGQEMSIE